MTDAALTLMHALMSADGNTLINTLSSGITFTAGFVAAGPRGIAVFVAVFDEDGEADSAGEEREEHLLQQVARRRCNAEA